MDNWTNAKWCDVANLVLGAFLFFSPWVLGFQGTTNAMTIHVVVGIAVAVLAAIELWMMQQIPPRFTVNR